MELKDETLMELLDRERVTGSLLDEHGRVEKFITEKVAEIVELGKSLDYASVYLKDLMAVAGYDIPLWLQNKMKAKKEGE